MNNLREIPSNDFIEKTSSLMSKAMDNAQWQLRCEDVELSTDEVTAKDGLLPLIVWIAGKNLEKLWGSQELVFRCDPNALCGVIPEFQRPVLPASIWLHAVHCEIETAATSMDVSAVVNGWFERWNAALSDKSILLLPPKSPSLNGSTT